MSTDNNDTFGNKINGMTDGARSQRFRSTAPRMPYGRDIHRGPVDAPKSLDGRADPIAPGRPRRNP